MTKNEQNNPWADRENERANEPAVEEGETLHQEDEMIDEELDGEVDELESAASAGADDEMQEKLAQAKDQLIRAHAEIDNVRRRAEQDVARAHKYALEKFAESLLSVADSLEQALQNKPENDPMAEGVELTYKMLVDTLEKFSVKQLNPEKAIFDPKLHEAISMQPNSGEEANTVLAVVQKGYTLNDRLIRPARVVVAQ